MITAFLKYIRDHYIPSREDRPAIPDFKPDQICRYRITFSGRVQGVGFRFEAFQLAKQLELTGFCENLPDGDVLAEFQGPENRILFLVAFMESLKRIVIEEKIMVQIPVLDQDHTFEYR